MQQEQLTLTGEILFDGLSPGDVYVKETKAKSGYLNSTDVKKVTVSNGETANVSFKDEEPLGKISIYKVDNKGYKVVDARFQVTAMEDIKNASGKKTFYNEGDIVGEITTDETNGIATIDNIPLGKYKLKELYAPNRILNKQYRIYSKS